MSEQLYELCLRYRDGLLDDADHAALQDLLREGDEARRAFVEMLYQMRVMKRMHAVKARTATVPARRLMVYPRRRATWFGIAAAIVLMAALAVMYRPLGDATKTDLTRVRSVAVLTQMHDTAWGQGSIVNADSQQGDQISTGLMRLESGSTQVLFNSGAVVDLCAPCNMRMTDQNRASLESGWLSAYVPEQARGFTIDLPGDWSVRDLGTQFDVVRTADGNVYGYVRQGLVEVRHEDKYATWVKAGDGWSITGGDTLGKLDVDDARTWTLVRTGRAMPTTPVRVGLSVWYRFDLNSADDYAVNLIGPRYAGDAAFENARMTEVDGMRGLRIASGADLVALPIRDSYKACTFAVRVRLDALGPDFNGLLMSDSGGSRVHWQIERNGDLVFDLAGDHRYAFPDAVTADQLHKWMHLAMTYDTEHGLMRAYRDGQLIGEQPIAHAVRVQPGAAHIGGWLPESSQPPAQRALLGAIAELAIYNRALSHEEIQKIAAPAPRPTPAKPANPE
ncbi:MAG: hypothetical protein GC162_18230 [Planctomycetes bacterium]|nr:hypothetical protein [Planctomycetota bacterium]